MYFASSADSLACQSAQTDTSMAVADGILYVAIESELKRQDQEPGRQEESKEVEEKKKKKNSGQIFHFPSLEALQPIARYRHRVLLGCWIFRGEPVVGSVGIFGEH